MAPPACQCQRASLHCIDREYCCDHHEACRRRLFSAATDTRCESMSEALGGISRMAISHGTWHTHHRCCRRIKGALKRSPRRCITRWTMRASAAAVDPRRSIIALALTIFTAAASIPPRVEGRRLAMRSVCLLITVDVTIPARTAFAATARIDAHLLAVASVVPIDVRAVACPPTAWGI